ncbi:MAG: hypothetical protein AUH12_04965 [Gemmatimonadetes bacterium 13_2_20CM_69_8]|nr:MAG: hypothetical protein AUH12_04965 [Gemmatimonadetes bacterium 13_2_20CM_69_8]
MHGLSLGEEAVEDGREARRREQQHRCRASPASLALRLGRLLSGRALRARLSRGDDVGLGGATAEKSLINCVPPPLATASASSPGSNTSCTSPNRTSAPGASGLSPFTRSPSTKLPFVESRSTTTHTPSRRCSFAWAVETDGSGKMMSL